MLLVIFILVAVVNGDNDFSFLSANVAKDRIDKIQSNLMKAEKIPITDARSLHTSDSWLVSEFSMSQNDCEEEQPFEQYAYALGGCSRVPGSDSSYIQSCSDNGTSTFSDIMYWANTDCSGTPVSKGSDWVGYTDCNDGFRFKCLQRSDHFELTENADYGRIQYVDDTCSPDETNIVAVQSYYTAERCLSFNGSFNFMIGDCGNSAYVYDDSDCTNLIAAETYKASSYSCQSNGTKVDDYYMSDDAAFNYVGSFQNFCAANANDNDVDADADADEKIRLKHSPGLRKKIGDKGRFPPLPMTPPNKKSAEIGILLHQQEVAEHQQEVSEHQLGSLAENAAPVTSSWVKQSTSFWLIGAMLLFAGGVAVVKLLKAKNDFQKIPENSAHSI